MWKTKRLEPKHIRRVLISAVGSTVAVMAFRVMGDIKSAANALPSQVEMAKAEGLAVEPLDLLCHVPVGDNAAPLYRVALASFDKRPYSDTSDRMQALSQYVADGRGENLARSSVAKWSKTIRAAELASEKPSCDFERIWKSDTPDEYVDLKCFVRLLSARALLTGRLQDLDTARRISNHAGSDPTLSSALVQADCNRIWMDACWHFAKNHRDDFTVLLSVRQLLSCAEMPSLKPRLRGELVFARARIRRMTFKPESDPQSLDPAAEAAGGFAGNEVAVAASESRLIEVFRKLNKSLPNDRLDWNAQIQAFRNVCNSEGSSLSSRLNSYLMPDLPEVAKKCRRMEERQKAIDQAISLLLTGKPEPQPTPTLGMS